MKIQLTLLAALALAGPAICQPAWFAPDAAAKQSLTDALAAARNAHHRLIVMYEGNWCGLCAETLSVAMADPDIPQLVQSGYEVAHLETEDFAGLQQFAQQSLHAKLEKGNVVLITVLENDGAVLTTLTAARLLENGHVAAAKIKAQLSEWLIGAPADDVYGKGLASLAAGKAGWVEFRADWCSWCKKMEKFFQDSDAAPVLAKYYTVITVDTEKNAGSGELAKRLGAPKGIDGGIPWFAVVDAGGKVLATSEGPEGNIGYPDSAVEITHFLAMLKATAKGISAGEIASIAKTIEALKPKKAATGH